MSTRPLFVVLEGVDGCGKSTQAQRLCGRLQAEGRDVLHVREPGTTVAGERIRTLLLDPALGEIAPITEVFLYQAARAQLVREIVRPALEAGHDVVCERWHYATTAYQGVAAGAGIEAVKATSRLATGGTEPHRAILLDVPDDVAGRRLGEFLDRIESRGSEYRATVAAALRSLFHSDPALFRIVAADGSQDEVAAAVWDAVRDLL